jgi:hypothetical protein
MARILLNQLLVVKLAVAAALLVAAATAAPTADAMLGQPTP